MKTSAKNTPMTSPTKTTSTKEPFSLRKVMRFSTASKPQAHPMSHHRGDQDAADYATGLSHQASTT